MHNFLVASDKPEIFQRILAAVADQKHIKIQSDPEQVVTSLREKRYDFLFIELTFLTRSLKAESLKKSLQAFSRIQPGLKTVVLSSQKYLPQAVLAVKVGADSYLTYPIVEGEVKLIIDSISSDIIKDYELNYLRDQFWRHDVKDIVFTNSPVMKDVFSKIRLVAPTRTNVLLIGETGTGKSALVRLIHQHSRREKSQFISVHCGAIPDTLLESELFGHEKGAFTDAIRRKLGKFEIARNGTIFLDEIGTISPAAQVKLLQVLQDGTFCRVGGEDSLETNARVITATNADLKQMVAEGQFRKDLYYRLNVFPIEIPPLRQRTEDLPLFIAKFLDKLNDSHQKNMTGVHHKVIEALKRYDWPGNVRELENLIERAYILENSAELTPESFPTELFTDELMHHALVSINNSLTLSEARQQAIADFERQYLKNLLARTKGKIKMAAEEAAISSRQLHKLMTKYGIRKEDFKT